MDTAVAGEILGELLRVPGLLQVVQLRAHGLGELLHQRGNVETGDGRRRLLGPFGELGHDLQVLVHLCHHARAPHFHDDVVAPAGLFDRRLVHLADGAGGQRNVLQRCQQPVRAGPSSSAMTVRIWSAGTGGEASWSFASSAAYSGGSTSVRVETIWPNLM